MSVSVENQKEYKISMVNRKNLVVEGVQNVETFDDEEIILDTKMGLLILKGENLHIVQLNLEEGTMIVEGHCKSLDFTEDKNVKGFKDKGKGLLQRILR